MYFASKKGIFAVIIWGTIIGIVFLNLSDPVWARILLTLPIIVVLAWGWFRTGYTISANDLRILVGPFHFRIPLSEIRMITQPRSPFELAALLSLDRIEIHYGKFGNRLQVSPKDKHGFLKLIERQCPQVEIESELRK